MTECGRQDAESGNGNLAQRRKGRKERQVHRQRMTMIFGLTMATVATMASERGTPVRIAIVEGDAG